MDRFFLIELREAKAQEFISLWQGNMTVQEYEIKFNQLSRYAPHMVSDFRAQMNKFLCGVSDLVKNKCRNSMFLGDINISRLMTHAQQVEGYKIKEHGMARRIISLGLGSMTILNRNRVVEISRRVQRSF